MIYLFPFVSFDFLIPFFSLARDPWNAPLFIEKTLEGLKAKREEKNSHCRENSIL